MLWRSGKLDLQYKIYRKKPKAMKLRTNTNQDLNDSLVLSLQREQHSRNYYLISEKRRRQLILMEDSSSEDESDNYTVFNSWEEALKDLNKFEGAIAAGKRWWSYCPGWMYFNPAYIHQGLKQIFGKLIVKSLDEIEESDVVMEEKERFTIWAQTCSLKNSLNMIH